MQLTAPDVSALLTTPELIWSTPSAEYWCGCGVGGLRAQPDDSLDAVITDVPYGVMTKENLKKSAWGTAPKIGVIRRNVDFDEATDLPETLREFLETAARKVKPDAWLVIFCEKEGQADFLRAVAAECGLRYYNELIWHKTNPAPRIRAKGPMASHETALLLRRGNPDFYSPDPHRSHTVVTFPTEPPPRRWHETQKSLELMKTLATWFCPPGGLVADPFAGSGQTLRACLATGRRGIAWELSANRAAVARLALNNDLPAARALATSLGILLAAEDTAPVSTQGSLFGPEAN